METNNSPSVNVAGQERSTVTPAMESLRLLRYSMAQVLNPIQYQVFALHFVDGVPQWVIADELEMTRIAVSRCYTHAVEILKIYWHLKEGRLVKHRILDCLEDVLTEKQFRVFYRVFFSGEQQKYIAAENGTSKSAASRTYASALNRLRSLWNT